ncbi:hypothetical protein H4R20_002120 [Coemansia guatemalensis]|uniref:Spp2/MOS2 G-patch domain-containing protein n=1 Tax=Coemansia guatemalensis TaxID=2761395 RepID=A0A9W8LSL0_9FUNG|nr:hypothetical protein H4R20_002120 [Coemansia guatemalensis]
MRRSGPKPSARLANNASNGKQGFSGFKISAASRSTTPAISKPSAFEDETNKKSSRPGIGVEMAIVDAQDGNVIFGQGEKEAQAPLVIPAKRNVDRVERSKAAQVAQPDDSLRQLAISELTGGNAESEKPPRVIQSKSQADREQRAYEDEISDYSDVSEDAYERVPVEEFGAAMLRGMGWKDDNNGKPVTADIAEQPRPSLLGLGAQQPPKEMTPEKRRQKRF